MTTARLAHVPIDHALAELAAFPLASPSALQLRPFHLHPDLCERTDQLWRQAETHILASFPTFSVDEIVALRDRIWFCHETDKDGRPNNQNRAAAPVAMHTYLHEIAKWYLEVQGVLAVPRLPSHQITRMVSGHVREARARQAWRWLSFALPPDLLLAAHHDQNGGPDRIALLSPNLSAQLKDGQFAETHLHVGAAMEFPTFWIATLRALAQQRFTHDVLHSPGAELNSGKLLASWLIRAAVVRSLLAAYLRWGEKKRGLAGFLGVEIPTTIARKVGLTGEALLRRGLDELLRGRLDRSYETDFRGWQNLYRAITGVTQQPFPADLNRLSAADPIAPMFPHHGVEGPRPETRFVVAALSHLKQLSYSRRQFDQLFAELFWQVVRIRNVFYRHIVQRPMTPGLQWFIRFYGRLGPVTRTVPTRVLVQSAAHIDGFNRGLKSLEVRRSPSTSSSEQLQWLREINLCSTHLNYRSQSPQERRFAFDGISAGQAAEQARKAQKHNGDPFELSVVFHFAKERGGGGREGLPLAHWRGSNADPAFRASERTGRGQEIQFFGDQNISGYRYSNFFRRRRREAIGLAWVLQRFPHSLELVRALDVCTDELGVPNWVLAPLIRGVRDAAGDGIRFARRLIGSTLFQLRTTAHAGEDFVHLATGLRNVDEVLDRFHMREGDRLGHALAIGLDPSDWAARAGRVFMPREDRLFDLIWQWSFGQRINEPAIHARNSSVENEIVRIGEIIFDQACTPHQLQTLVDDLYDENMLKAAGFPDGQTRLALLRLSRRIQRGESVLRNQRRLTLLLRFLTDDAVFRRGREIIDVDPVPEGPALDCLQSELRRKIGTRGVTVEVNPTSNLLIGDLADLSSHPLWRMNPPRPRSDLPPIPICIGTDDPMTFATRLREEYQCLADALTLTGLSDEESRRWLERIRESGMEARSSLPRESFDFISPIRYTGRSSTIPLF